MCTRNDITLVQHWICCRRGKEEQDDYLSRIDLEPDNNVADAVTRLEEVGYELEKNSWGDYVLVRSIRGACNAANGGTVGSAPAPENIRLTAVAATTEGTFELCPPDQWEKAQKKFGDLFADYKVLFNRWTRSGTHGEFQEMMDEAIAHSEENTNPAMLYLHEYLAQSNNHKLFDICLGLIPSDTFSDTVSGPPCHHSRVKTGHASARRNGGGRPSGMSRVSGGGSGG